MDKDIQRIKDIIEVWDLEQVDEHMQMIIYKNDIEAFRNVLGKLNEIDIK